MKARTETKSTLPHCRGIKRGLFGWIVGGIAVVLVCLVIRHQWAPDQASAKPLRAERSVAARSVAPRTAPRAVPRQDGQALAAKPQVVATVNGEPITREQLGQVCLVRFGKEVLESLMNRQLIAIACQQRNIAVTNADVQAEIERMARRFHLGSEQWLGMLHKERGISQEQYARDIVWPMLALQRLAADRLEISKKEISDAYQSQYGPAVRARLIVVDSLPVARQVHAQVTAQPDEFVRLAQEKSQDVTSASLGGLIEPIRRNAGDPQIEQVAFGLKQGDVSPIIRVGSQYVILKCEGHLAARKVPMADVQEALTARIRARKLRTAADGVFQDLEAKATIKNVMNDPVASRQTPGVAATINGQPIMLATLAEQCTTRHGREVLAGRINRRLLTQALKQSQLQVTSADLTAEVAHAAELAGMLDASGRPDTEKWTNLVTEQREITRDVYLQDIVWPAAALKKLTANKVHVLDEDLRKGYEANYGSRVRCRAIVMSNLRRAQEVWDKARKNPTPEFFGDLAEQYSIEPTSRALRGEVPPIKRNSGQPILEREAFALQPNQLSGIIQIGENFVILFCEGLTTPVQVDLEEVRDLIRTDIYEKKLRIAMEQAFEKLHSAARIDNYLTGDSQQPKTSRQPTSAVRPASATTSTTTPPRQIRRAAGPRR